MSCNNLVLNGLGVGCRDGIGGIIEVYIANYDDVSVALADTSTSSATYNKIKTITMAGTAKFKTYRLRRQSSSFTSTVTTDETTGCYSVQTDLSMTISKLTTLNISEVDALSKKELVAIVKDANGRYFYMGYDNYVYCTATTMQTGTAVTDANNITITLTDLSNRLPYEVDSALITSTIIDSAPTAD